MIVAGFFLFGCSSGGKGGLTTVSGIIGDVGQNMVPDSLEYPSTQSSSAVHAASDSDPCAGVSSFEACQPILLRLYLSMAKMVFDASSGMIEEVSTEIGALGVGTGTVTKEHASYTYNKTSDSEFSILGRDSNNQPFIYVRAADMRYEVRSNFAKLPDEVGSASDEVEAVQLNIDYTSANQWVLTVTLYMPGCDPNDVGKPEIIRLYVTKSGSLWKGKAMMYNPRWGGDNEVNCETEPSDATAKCLYTDFVADDSAGKASVFILPRTISDVNLITDYGINVMNGSLTNPFCNPTQTMAAVWDNACSDYSATVSTTDFGPATEWTTPSDLYQVDVALPDSL